jgi:hypothetical protein
MFSQQSAEIVDSVVFWGATMSANRRIARPAAHRICGQVISDGPVFRNASSSGTVKAVEPVTTAIAVDQPPAIFHDRLLGGVAVLTRERTDSAVA